MEMKGAVQTKHTTQKMFPSTTVYSHPS